jgi:hypothetical protein
MNLIFRYLDWKTSLTFLNDVIVVGRNFESHLHNLCKTLEQLRKNNVMLKTNDCEIFKKEIEYFDCVISKHGMCMLEKDIDCVLNSPVPKNNRELQRFLGFVNRHRDFVSNFCDITEPLYQIASKGKFEWNGKHQRAFDELKHILINPPVLKEENRVSKLSVSPNITQHLVNGRSCSVSDIPVMKLEVSVPPVKIDTQTKDQVEDTEGNEGVSPGWSAERLAGLSNLCVEKPGRDTTTLQHSSLANGCSISVSDTSVVKPGTSAPSVKADSSSLACGSSGNARVSDCRECSNKNVGKTNQTCSSPTVFRKESDFFQFL